jgi:hypothetical protein
MTMISRFRHLLAGAALAAAVATAAVAQTGWVLTTDYSTFGRARSFALDTAWTVSGDLATTPGDAVGRHHDGLVYVVGRGGASILQIYDPDAGFALVREFSLGAGRNPQDIVFDAEGDAYVSCYDAALLLRVDTEAGSVVETFSTAAFADADGLPETAWMLADGDRLYVAAQKLDRDNWYAPSGPGALLVFDMTAEAWVDMDEGLGGVQPIALTGADPYTRIEKAATPLGDRLRVGCVGSFGSSDGGIEQVDPVTGQSEGYLVTEAVLGGDINAFVSTGSGGVFAVISDASFNTLLRRWTPDGGAVTLAPGAGFVHADVAWDGDFQVYLADRTPGASGLRVFDAASGAELTAEALATGLPPFSFVLAATGGASSVPPIPAGNLSLGAPYPNPCNPAASIIVRGPAEAPVRVEVYDLAGRRVVARRMALDAGGSGEFRFDGRDARGAALPAGVYRVAVRGANGFAARSLTLLK